jgi:hypothetical protein
MNICTERKKYHEKLMKTNDTSGNVYNITVNNFLNETININVPEFMVEDVFRTTIKDEHLHDYVRAGKWVTEFNKKISNEPENKNVILNNVKSMSTQMLTDKGWVTMYTEEAIDKVFKVRSGQLVNLKEQINDYNGRVLKSKKINDAWWHLEKFKEMGLEHHGQGNDTRRVRSEFKVSLTPL